MIRTARLFAIVLPCLFAGGLASAQESGPVTSESAPLLAAGGPDHVFLAMPLGTGWSLFHHEPSAGSFITPLRQLVRPPLALAARGTTMWLVSASAGTGPREVFRLQLRRGPDGRWIALPGDRLEKLPALPGDGVLVGFAAMADGPVALLAPDPMGRRAGQMRLQRLDRSGWTDLQPPQLAGGGATAHLGVWGPDASSLLVLGRPADERSARRRTHAWWLPAGHDAWTMTPLPFDARAVEHLARGLGGWPIVARASRGELNLDYIEPADATGGQGGTLRPLSRVSVDASWAMVGGTGRVRLYQLRRSSEASVRALDVVLGTWSDETPLGARASVPGEAWRGPMLLAVAAFALVMAVFLRPGMPRTCTLPPGTMAAAPTMRLVAFTIDFIPGLIVATLALGVHPAEVLRLPLTTLSLADGLPYAVAGVITVAIGFLGEWTRGTTPGKAVLGLRVVSADGERLRFGQASIRAAVRLPVVLAPMLAAFALVNPNGQGLPDLVARTVVVARRAVPNEPE